MELASLTRVSRSHKMEEMIVERVTAKEAELHATYDERLRNSEER